MSAKIRNGKRIFASQYLPLWIKSELGILPIIGHELLEGAIDAIDFREAIAEEWMIRSYQDLEIG